MRLSKLILTSVLSCFFVVGCVQQDLQSSDQTTNKQLSNSAPEKPLNAAMPQPNATPKTNFDDTEIEKVKGEVSPYGKRFAVPPKILKQMLRENKELRQCLSDDYKNDFSEFSEPIVAENQDFNDDDIKDFIVSVENRCSGHNSPTYVYLSDENKYKSLLYVASNGIQVKKSKSNGFFDLAVSSRTSCCSGIIDIYKYSKGKYHITLCYNWETVKTEGEKEKAIVTPHDCSEPH